jgi:UDP-GlcNAc:undecaprenyl-phosphate/decaprenyl-phosphate GlcNAc-1-phosphate transferase
VSAAIAIPVAVLVAAVGCYVLTIAAMRVARAVQLVDRPKGYKRHERPTPYLGGAAVVLALVAATAILVDVGSALAVVLGGAAVLAVVGLLDDRFAVPPLWRVGVELAVAWVLFHNGVRWSLFGSSALDFALSAFWIVGVVNAFNLMDNIDGAAATVAAVCAGGAGVLALTRADTELAVAAFALTGACAGFLGQNLRSPARIFLGDGGSMPIGLIVAGLAMLVVSRGPLGGSAVLAGALIVGLPILDTALVVISRRRRRTPVMQGNVDHLTHRLLPRAGSTRRLAGVLALTQGAFVAVAIGVFQLGELATDVAAATMFVLGLYAIRVLESPAWHPLFAAVDGRGTGLVPGPGASLGAQAASLGAAPSAHRSARAPGFARIKERAGIE